MAIKLVVEPGFQITLTALIEYLTDSGVLESLRASCYSQDDMLNTATHLKALALNRHEVLQHISNALVTPETFQYTNNGQSQSYVLYTCPIFTLRLMVWIPVGFQARSIPFSYRYAHDHAFDLMSVGFFGPGYRTSLYGFDYSQIEQSDSGETLFSYAGDMFLEEGDIIYYYANKDVHIQHEPVSLSASLNLIIPKSIPSVRQTIFELSESAGRIVGKPIFNNLQRVISQRSIFSLMAYQGNLRTQKLLIHIAKNHQSEEARAMAWAAILRHQPSQSLIDSALDDSSNYVRNAIQAVLVTLQEKIHDS
ncbi:hypothetical protein OO184_09695 [Photorhabdus sp. APURE]|uniref:hypothetical protein n=1 Tax=Photorhabdus aballayi TaxID=2991723 RepID=UPI00223D9390|nr:hypothetical protein [Photorhabdus aballayi]MCW7548201.1 hypothetical protein [Photorhabdus aballayi]